MARNWAGNHTYVAARRHAPTSVEALQELVRTSRACRVLGSRHSFNDIADTPGDLITLDQLPRVFDLDPIAQTLTIDGSARYGDIAPRLDQAGFALANLASLPHISVAGACATATHGSGDRLGTLATAVRALEFVTGDGDLARCTRGEDPDTFAGMVVSLGALGAVTRLTLDVEPTYRVRQDVYDDLPMAEAVEHFDEIMSSADSVSLFTEWRGPTVDQVWRKRRVVAGDGFEAARAWFGATLAVGARHPIRRLPAAACTDQLGVPGPWYDRLPHFRLDHTPSAGDELQTEYLIPRHHGPAALLAMDGLRGRIAPLLLVSEIRTVAADDLWLSTAQDRASVAIHFTWRPDWAAVRDLLPTIEAALVPFEPRPHWGKLFTMAPDEVRAAYPRRVAFVALRDRLDPTRTFHNEFVERYLG